MSQQVRRNLAATA